MEKSKCCGAEALRQVGGQYGCKKCESYCEIIEKSSTMVKKQEEIKAICKDCGRKFHTWLSDSKECPECEGQMMFFDSLEPIEDWQKKFLDTGTLLGFGDLSGMIGVISSILSSQSSKIKQEMVKEIENMDALTPVDRGCMSKVSDEAKIPKYGQNYLGREDVITIINNSN